VSTASPLQRGGLARFAVASGVAIGVIYLPQQLLTLIGEDFDVDPALASATATSMQIGYALGILLLVSLSDRAPTRRLVDIMSLATVALLALAALSPALPVLCVLLGAAGGTTTIAQVLLPTALRAASPGHRGRTTGIMLGAFIIGIFGTRIVESWVAEAVGWRLTLVVFAAAMLAAALLVRGAVPKTRPNARAAPYGRILLSLPRLFATVGPLRLGGLTQFFMFAAFQAVWVTLVLHLTAPPHSWSISQAGLAGGVGILAGLCTIVIGPAVDRFGSGAVVRVTLLAGIAGAALILFGADAIPLLLLGLFALTLANQVGQAGNQAAALTASGPERSGSANTVFMFLTFLGSSFGSAAAPIAFGWGRLEGVALFGIACFCAAGVLQGLAWARFRRTR